MCEEPSSNATPSESEVIAPSSRSSVGPWRQFFIEVVPGLMVLLLAIVSVWHSHELSSLRNRVNRQEQLLGKVIDNQLLQSSNTATLFKIDGELNRQVSTLFTLQGLFLSALTNLAQRTKPDQLNSL